jgi:hypothetical protein
MISLISKELSEFWALLEEQKRSIATELQSRFRELSEQCKATEQNVSDIITEAIRVLKWELPDIMGPGVGIGSRMREDDKADHSTSPGEECTT